ncbi:hypothetical protein AZE42_02946 [Rhizopogon vesiculosus]|uniref:Uncharacterized protein n=1 Tax=Rhizopogon vesiculosus TaxID=180088 RepID=A0A1J8Q162_9AGAM|nr:hypothetical protein AZE42_02946 [Rhizopogon vesiculosus]
MASPPFEIYFTGRDDPRDCIIIGEDMQPVFFEFETQCLSPSTVRTTISSNRNPVAAFDWGANGASLGVATIGNREIPMAQLVQPGSPGYVDISAAPMMGSTNKSFFQRSQVHLRGW